MPLTLLIALAACSPAAAPPPPSPSPPAAVATLTLGPATTPVTQGTAPPPVAAPPTIVLKEFPVPAGSAPHDVAPAADGGVWFTAQRSGQLGWLDPKTGQTKMIRLGAGSAPHGVITDQNGIAWVTDSGLNAIVSVDPRANDKVTVYKIQGPNVNLNTAVIDRDGVIWFTGQAGYIGRLVPFGLEPMPEIQPAPRGAGPYGITSAPPTPSLPGGGVYYASLAGDHIARVIPTRGAGPAPAFRAQSIDPPTQSAGPRRVWSDSKGVIWVSEWNAGQLGRYDPATQQWKEWKLPGTRPQAYAVFVDDRDIVWLTDFGASAIVRFDPATERSDVFPHAPGGNVRQLHGRPGEVWGALSALDKLLLVTTR